MTAKLLHLLRSRFGGLRTRVVALVLLAVVPAFGLTLYSAAEQRALAADAARADALRLARLVANQEEQLIEGGRQLVVGLAQLPEVRERDTARCSAIFASVLRQFPWYTNVAAASLNGDLYCSRLPTSERLNVSDHMYFRRTLDTQSFVVGEYTIGPGTGKPTVTLAYPAIDDVGAVRAVVIVGVDLGWLSQLLAEVQLPEGADVLVVDGSGTILARYPDPERWVGRSASNDELVKTIMRQPADGAIEQSGLDGARRLYGFTRLRGTERAGAPYVTVGIPTSVALAAADRLSTRNLAGLAIVGILALLAAWFGADVFFLRQVNALVMATRRLSAGELRIRAGPLYAAGELGFLARAFDDAAGALEQRDAALRRARDELEVRVHERTADLSLANEALARHAENLSRSNAELEQFAYVASHDLQEPLRMVASYTQLLARRYRGRLDADADDFIGYAVDGATRMQQLIQDLLTYSRVGRKPKDFGPTDCDAVLDQALANLTETIRETGAVVSRGPLPTVTGDGVQLVQLFQNLISNAVKFRGGQPPDVRVSAAMDGRECVFSVRDNGIGIEPQYRERIFQIFTRLHGRGEFPGTGIGLAICWKIVERHGGRIWVESQPGDGSTFSFTIPAIHEEGSHGRSGPG